VNAGIYVLSPGVLSYLPAQSFFNMPALFEKLIAAGEITAADPLREYWMDIGQHEELQKAQKEWVGDDG
jgi:NDP-sugar pyrophosphorylase family protein